MRYVKYIGPAHARQITAHDWRSVGVQADTVVWLPQNGFAVPLEQFTEDMLRKAIDKDPYLVITGEGDDQDEEFKPAPVDNPLTTPAMLEAGRFDPTDPDQRDAAFTGQLDGVADDTDDDADRSTPRSTTGGSE
jgi:hypothetical protein